MFPDSQVYMFIFLTERTYIQAQPGAGHPKESKENHDFPGPSRSFLVQWKYLACPHLLPVEAKKNERLITQMPTQMLGDQQNHNDASGWGHPTLFHGKGSFDLGLEDGEASDLGGRRVYTLLAVAREEVGVGTCRGHSAATLHGRF